MNNQKVKCGHINYNPDKKEIENTGQYYLNNINVYNKRQKQFNKILKILRNVVKTNHILGRQKNGQNQ
jgi:hypothetical protein